MNIISTLKAKFDEIHTRLLTHLFVCLFVCYGTPAEEDEKTEAEEYRRFVLDAAINHERRLNDWITLIEENKNKQTNKQKQSLMSIKS